MTDKYALRELASILDRGGPVNTKTAGFAVSKAADEIEQLQKRIDKLVAKSDDDDSEKRSLRIQLEGATKLASDIQEEVAKARLEAANFRHEFRKSGWRACIDHIIKPDSPCPVCAAEKLAKEVGMLKGDNAKLEKERDEARRAADQWRDERRTEGLEKEKEQLLLKRAQQQLQDQWEAHLRELNEIERRARSEPFRKKPQCPTPGCFLPRGHLSPCFPGYKPTEEQKLKASLRPGAIYKKPPPSVQPMFDKESLDEILAQQRMILNMHEHIIAALSSPQFIVNEEASGDRD